jgi:hypothetical protein
LSSSSPTTSPSPLSHSTANAAALTQHSIEKAKGDGHHGGGLLRAASAPRLSGLLRARLDKVHLFGRLHLRKDLKTSHFGGNWKRRWCMLRGCNILIFKTEQAGVDFAEHTSTFTPPPHMTLSAMPADAADAAPGEAHIEAVRSGAKPYQIIELDACERVEQSGSLENMRFTFKLVLPGRLPVIAAAASEAELKSWVDTLEAVLAGEADPAAQVRHSLVLRGNVHIRKSGTMYHLGFNWKQRHMVLDGHHIVITKTDDPEDPVRRELKLLSSSRCGPLDTERPHTFVVINFDPVVGDTQPLVVSASDDEEMMHWASTVQQAIQELAWEEEGESVVAGEGGGGGGKNSADGVGRVQLQVQEVGTGMVGANGSGGGESKQQRGPGQGHRRRATGSSSSSSRRRGPRTNNGVGVLSRAAARAMERALTEAQKSKAELQAQVSNLASTLQRTKRELGRAQRKQQGQAAAAARNGSPQRARPTQASAAATAPAPASALVNASSSSSAAAAADSASILALRAQVEALTQQLRNNQLRMHQGEHGEERDDGWDGSLESAMERLTAAATRLQGGDEAAQGEFDKWDKIVAGHPEHKAKLAAADLAWENAAAPKCTAALELMRTFVPSAIFSMKKEALATAGVPKPLVRRLFTKKILHLLRMETADIAKVHIVDLRNRYASQGLDIVEMRAVYKVLPQKFLLDGDGAKKRWRKDFRNRLMRLTKMEDAGNLRGNAMRHSAYRAAAGEQGGGGGAFAGDSGVRKTRAVAGEDYSGVGGGGGGGGGGGSGGGGGGRKKKKNTTKKPALPFGPGALAAALEKKKKKGGGGSGGRGGRPGRGPNPMAAMLEAQFAKQRSK